MNRFTNIIEIMKKFVIYFIISFVVVFLIVWGVMKFYKKVDDLINKDKNEAEISNKRVQESNSDFNISAPELRVEYNNNEVSADMKYKDKIITVEGRILEIAKTSDGKQLEIQLITESYGRNTSVYGSKVSCFFSLDNQNAISNLSKSDLVSIKGICKGIEYSQIEFESCILVSSKKSFSSDYMKNMEEEVKWQLSLPLTSN